MIRSYDSQEFILKIVSQGSEADLFLLYLQSSQIYNIKMFHTSQRSGYLGVFFLQTGLSYCLFI